MAENTLYYDNDVANRSTEVDRNSSIATSNSVLSGYLFQDAVTREPLVGTMPDNGYVYEVLEPSTNEELSYYVIPEGYHNGTGMVVAPKIFDYTFGTATAEDLAYGKTAWVNGEKIVGTLDVRSNAQEGNATSSDLLSSKVAWVNGERIVGNIPYLYRVDKTLLPGESYTIPYGFSTGESIITAAELSSQTVGDATAEDIAYGKTVWVNGEKIVGTYRTDEAIREWLSEATVDREYVLEGNTFYSTLYNTVVEGTMIDHSGEETRVLTNGDIFYIPAGYYNGLTAIEVTGLGNMTVANMKANDLIEGKTAWVNGIKVTGTMPKIENINTIVACDEVYTIPMGFHSGEGIVRGKDLASQTQATAISDNIYSGKTAWVNGIQITGTMTINPHIEKKLEPGEQYMIPMGFHTGTDFIYTDSIADQTQGTATAASMLEGTTAWVNGVEIVGTIPVISNQDINLDGGESYTIPAGYYDGTSIITANAVSDQTPGTATAEDIISGKTAWVNGVKITGNIELTGDAISVQVLKGKTFYNTNVHQQITGELELTGNATADKVLKGLKFYSDDPFTQLEGTLELTGDARTAHVLAGETFYTTHYDFKETGTMINRGAIVKGLTSGEVYTIPAGYHNGNGRVTAPSIESVTEGTATASDIINTKTAWVGGQKLTGTLELTGNAATENVLIGKTFYSTNPKTKLTGTMPNITDIDTELQAAETYIIEVGYHNTQVTISAADLTDQTSGTATAADMLEGVTAWVNGQEVIGTIPVIESFRPTISAGDSYTIPAGYHDGNSIIYSESLTSQTQGTAIDSDILINRTAWVNGEQVIGTMPDRGTESVTLNCGETYNILQGYHSGSGVISANTLDIQTPGTATAANIFENEIAWVNGVQIIGTVPVSSDNGTTLYAGESVLYTAAYYENGLSITAVDLATQTPGNATASHILDNKNAWVNGIEVIGSMPNIGAESDTLNCDGTHTISAGYHDGTGVITAASLSSQTQATAVAGEILDTKTAWVNGVKLTGSMPNKGAITETINAGSTYTIPAGYHNGSGTITASDLSGQTSGTAVAGDILYSKTAWVNGTKLTGSMPNIGAESDTLNCGGTHTISAGYHDGTGVIAAASLASQTSGTAAAINILSTKTAWVNGTKLTGSMPNVGTITRTLNAGESYTIAEGYHTGTGVISAQTLANQTVGTATADDMIANKTAWVNGVQVTGNIPVRSGADTTINAGGTVTVPAGYYPNGFIIRAASLASQTDGTATAGDIVIDETAWVRGEKITGIIASGDDVSY